MVRSKVRLWIGSMVVRRMEKEVRESRGICDVRGRDNYSSIMRV